MRELNVAYGTGRHAARWVNKTTTWDNLIDRLREPIRTPESAAEYPKLSKGERDNIKDHGGFVAGFLKDGLRRTTTILSRSIAVLDGDRVPADFIDRFKQEHRFASFLYTTHSHTPDQPRVRIGFPLTRDVGPEEYIAIVRYLADSMGIEGFDECSYRVNQLMYWPTAPCDGEYVFLECGGAWLDPDTFLVQHPEWKDCSKLPHSSREKPLHHLGTSKAGDPRCKSGLVGAFCRAYTVTEAIEEYLQDVYTPAAADCRYTYIPGTSTAGVVIYDNDTFAYSNHATDPAFGKNLNAFDLVRIHRFGNLDDGISADGQVTSLPSTKAMLQLAASDQRVCRLLLEERQKQAQEDFSTIDDSAEVDDSWKNRLEYEPRSGRLANTLQNVILIMQNDSALHDIVFNQLADGMEIKGNVPWKHPSRFWRDADDAQLISYVDAHYGQFSARNYDIAVTKVTDDRSYHPIKEYFDSLPPWDGECRVDTLLTDYLGAEDTPLHRAFIRKILCAAVRRVKSPGTKFDYVLVLNGPQGKGKSTFIAKLAGEWFSDSLTLSDMNDKTAAEKLQGYWIHEIGEMAGMKKADLEKVKGFVARTDDKYRASFGRRVSPHPRQCVFFGTTNAENGYLRDITGNRRFWNVRVTGDGKCRSWDMTCEIIEQIWAEAMTYEAQGEQLYLPPDLEDAAAECQRDAMERDEREGIVQEYLNMLLPENWASMEVISRQEYVREPLSPTRPIGTVQRTQVSNIEIWCECFGKRKEDLQSKDSYAIAAIMMRIPGWKKTSGLSHIPLYGRQRIYTRE